MQLLFALVDRVDLIDVHILVSRLAPRFPQIDPVFLALAIMRVMRAGVSINKLADFEQAVAETLRTFGSGGSPPP